MRVTLKAMNASLPVRRRWSAKQGKLFAVMSKFGDDFNDGKLYRYGLTSQDLDEWNGMRQKLIDTTIERPRTTIETSEPTQKPEELSAGRPVGSSVREKSPLPWFLRLYNEPPPLKTIEHRIQTATLPACANLQEYMRVRFDEVANCWLKVTGEQKDPVDLISANMKLHDDEVLERRKVTNGASPSGILSQKIELTPRETLEWIRGLEGADANEITSQLDKYRPLLNLDVSHYNLLLNTQSLTSSRPILHDMALRGIQPDRITVDRLLNMTELTQQDLLQIHWMLMGTNINLDASLIEKLIASYSQHEIPQTGLVLLIKIAQIYESCGQNSPESTNNAPLQDKLALDMILTQLQGHRDRRAMFHHSIRPTSSMVESLLAVCGPRDEPIAHYLHGMVEKFNLSEK